eukprot:scaffold496711_cov50-Prasinocladus_malaysianus.AAC.1
MNERGGRNLNLRVQEKNNQSRLISLNTLAACRSDCAQFDTRNSKQNDRGRLWWTTGCGQGAQQRLLLSRPGLR